MDFQTLADLLYPDMTRTPEQLEEEFPPRALPEGAAVTRMAPSPTGFMHFGNLFPAVTSERLAHQSGGVFFLRIEDTDQKREVEGAVEVIIESLKHYGIRFDEGATIEGDLGLYGPYRQRQRKEIYQVIAKKLVRNGLAYPCFCTEGALEENHRRQEQEKANFGYYGKWAVCRTLSLEAVQQKLSAGEPFVLRFRSTGSPDKKIVHHDLIKGALELSENDVDHVLLKSDGIPTYHFAHVVDDHFMRTTHVVRGDEWLSTLPFHLQLFDAIGWKRPKFLHISPLMKQDGDSKRKLSKRKDPEAALTFYRQEGYPVDAVYEYILNTLNSNFEDWRRGTAEPATQFKFSYKKMSPSGALFDLNKLRDISKNVIAAMDTEQAFELATEWAEEYDPGFFALLTRDPGYTKRILAIGRGGKKPRKDLAIWSELKDSIRFFFDELFMQQDGYPENISKENIHKLLTEYADMYRPDEDNSAWFETVKALAERHGYCTDMKLYKRDPSGFSGSVADVSMVLRVAVCGRQQSPDLCEVMKILGAQKVIERICAAAALLK